MQWGSALCHRCCNGVVVGYSQCPKALDCPDFLEPQEVVGASFGGGLWLGLNGQGRRSANTEQCSAEGARASLRFEDQRKFVETKNNFSLSLISGFRTVAVGICSLADCALFGRGFPVSQWLQAPPPRCIGIFLPIMCWCIGWGSGGMGVGAREGVDAKPYRVHPLRPPHPHRFALASLPCGHGGR